MRTSACKTTLLLQLRILGLGFFQDEDVVLRRQPHPAQQVREPGIAVKPVKAWIDLQPKQSAIQVNPNSEALSAVNRCGSPPAIGIR